MATQIEAGIVIPEIVPVVGKKKTKTVGDLKRGDVVICLHKGPMEIPRSHSKTVLGEEPIIVEEVKAWTTYAKTLVAYHPTSLTKINSQVLVEVEFEMVTDEVANKAKETLLKTRVKNLKTGLSNNLSKTIGADPEVFIEDGNGLVIPAFKFLPSKETPLLSEYGGGYGGRPCYWDGFQAEYEVHPAECLSWMLDSTHEGLKTIQKAAIAFDSTAKLSLKTIIEVTQEELDSTDPKYTAFGCMPSWNVYGLKGQTSEGSTATFRSAGGHIHLGCGKLSEEETVRIVKALDAVLGVMCVALLAEVDSPIRRIYYGLPGEYRPKEYGLEYRVLSNGYMCHPVSANLVFDLARTVAGYGFNDLMNATWKATEEETIHTITECDVVKAKEIMERNKETILTLISVAGRQDIGFTRGDLVYKCFYKGLSSFIAEPANISKNWSLGKDDEWVNHCDGIGKNWNYSYKAIALGMKV